MPHSRDITLIIINILVVREVAVECVFNFEATRDLLLSQYYFFYLLTISACVAVGYLRV
jgi:hypothetical protein